MEILREYGVGTTIHAPVIKAGATDFAVGADWTPATGDVQVVKDGTSANIGTLPTALTVGNTVLWAFTLSASEMSAAKIQVVVGDAATKAVEDQSILISTYGDASGQHNFNDDVLEALGVNVTTIATLASQTSFTLTAGSADDDAYNGWGALVIDQTTNAQRALGVVSDYTGSTKTVTLDADPGIFTMATGDTVILIPGVLAAGLSDQAKLDVNAEVLDVLNTDTFAEPAQGAPGATVSLATKIGFLYKAWRNRSTQTSSEYALYNDDATTVDHKASVSDNGTTFDKGETGTGP